MKTARPILILLDVHAILHRAYHALPDFVSRSGVPTGGLYGLASMTIKIIAELKPDYLAACYDRPEQTFRKAIFDHYKAGRPKTDEALIAQIESSRRLFEALQIPIYDAPSFEADDIIGTIVEQTAPLKDLQIIIASGDMDTMQLVASDRVLVYTLKRGLHDTILYDEPAVQKRFQFSPKSLPDYKGLAGDASDNIIGIKGIGEKTATTLINHFGTLEKLYQKLKRGDSAFLDLGLSPRVIGLLRAGEEEALFSKTLATIRRDAPITFALPSQSWRQGFEPEVALALFREWEFRSLDTRLAALFATPAGTAEVDAAPEKEKVDPELLARARLAAWVLDSDKTDSSPTEDLEVLERRLIETDPKLDKVYREIELPLIPILKAAHERGILVDQAHLKRAASEAHQELTKLEQEIWRLAGREFNINSPKQLGVILFDELQLTAKGLKKTPGGARSTRESELVKLKEAHPIVPAILKQREVQKIISTYLDAIPALIAADGRLHTVLHQAGTTTGRFSSSDPNLQNIPQGDGWGLLVRQAFIASPDHTLVAFDYSQIEMRVLALLSGDEALTKIFQTGEDVHTAVAARVFAVAEAMVTKEMRRRAKVINFGIIYGMGVNALRANLGSSREEAALFYEHYFVTFPRIRVYFDGVLASARERGYTETYFGRRRYFPGLRSGVPFIKASAERMAMNAPLQGTAADIVKLAMIKAHAALGENNLASQAHLILQIHDELVYEIETKILPAAVPLIKKSLESILTAPIPFTVTTHTGRTWADLK